MYVQASSYSHVARRLLTQSFVIRSPLSQSIVICVDADASSDASHVYEILAVSSRSVSILITVSFGVKDSQTPTVLSSIITIVASSDFVFGTQLTVYVIVAVFFASAS